MVNKQWEWKSPNINSWIRFTVAQPHTLYNIRGEFLYILAAIWLEAGFVYRVSTFKVILIMHVATLQQRVTKYDICTANWTLLHLQLIHFFTSTFGHTFNQTIAPQNTIFKRTNINNVLCLENRDYIWLFLHILFPISTYIYSWKENIHCRHDMNKIKELPVCK